MGSFQLLTPTHLQVGWGAQEAGRKYIQDDPNWPKGYSIPWGVMLSIYTREKASWGLLLRNWLGIDWQQLYCASLVLYILIIIIHSFSVLLKSLHLNAQILLFFSPTVLSPISLGRGKQTLVWCLAAC